MPANATDDLLRSNRSVELPCIGAVDLTVGGQDVAFGRLFVINATQAGNVVVKLANGSAHTIAVDVGYNAYPYAVVAVTSATAVATYSNMV